MTLEAETTLQSYIVAGTGPYAVTWPWKAGSLRVAVGSAGAVTELDAGTWTVDPAEGASGNVWLTPAAAAAHLGRALFITRDTPAEQGWQGIMGERERGLEAQLDRMVMKDQELSQGVASSLRIEGQTPKPSYLPNPGTLMWDGEGLQIGPSADQIAGAQAAAEIAQSVGVLSLGHLSQYFRESDFDAVIPGHDAYPVGSVVSVAGMSFKKIGSGSSKQWILIQSDPARVMDQYLPAAEGAVRLRHVQKVAALTLLGNRWGFAGTPEALGRAEVLGLLGFRYYGDTANGGIDYPASPDVPNAATAERWGRVTTSAVADTAVTFAAPFASSQPLVFCQPIGTSPTERLTVGIGTPTTTGFSVSVMDSAGARVARVLQFKAMGNGD